MALKPSQILDILNTKRDEFTTFSDATLKRLAEYQKFWKELTNLSEKALAERLAKHPSGIGARPLEPLNKATEGLIPFQVTWQSREQSLAWVRDRLMGITTFAVDGSQIYPSKDLSVPIALVQVGWFENPHIETGHYEKDVRLDVMTPTDLQVKGMNEPVDRRVSMRRFEMETERLVEYMEAHAQSEDTLVFLDGSLVATFAEAFDSDARQFYVSCLLELLRTSDRCRVPLIAYIDTTYAQDLSVMVQQLYGLDELKSVHDAQLVNKTMEWGDRTTLFQCDRGGILAAYEEFQDQIGFTYLKTTREGYPARLELPLWMYEAGLLDRVLDWVRGEVIIGSGYPYVIETADQTAVLQADDRQMFYRILQDWADEAELNLRFSRKMVSKVRRR